MNILIQKIMAYQILVSMYNDKEIYRKYLFLHITESLQNIPFSAWGYLKISEKRGILKSWFTVKKFCIREMFEGARTFSSLKIWNKQPPQAWAEGTDGIFRQKKDAWSFRQIFLI
jgi:hypothetical protein